MGLSAGGDRTSQAHAGVVIGTEGYVVLGEDSDAFEPQGAADPELEDMIGRSRPFTMGHSRSLACPSVRLSPWGPVFTTSG